MKLSDSAERILKIRYYQENETWAKLCNRVSTYVAQAEKTEELQKYWKDKFYNAIYNLEMMPNSPTLKNAGTHNNMLAACFTLNIKDSRDGIFDGLKEGVITQSKGGGTGFSFSSLRPKGDLVRGVGGKASGPISFMRIYDLAIGETIRQGGLRAGAMLSSFDYRHPDILEFINCKQTEKDLTHFNISVLLNDEFFKSVEKNKEIDLWFPDYENYINYDNEWDGDFDKWLEEKKPIKVYNKVKAKEIWNAITDGGWKNGEPGIIFKDIVNQNTPHPKNTSIITTNP